MHPDKLFYEFEHDVFPLCHCKLKESHRHKLGCFWPAYCELAHVRRALHLQDHESDRALSRSGSGGTVTSIRKTTGESKQSSSLDLFRVSIGFGRHRCTMMDSLIIFHCPETDTDVRTLLLKQQHEETRPYYVAVTCPACTRLHFLDKSTGIALGTDE